ncbi:ABC transporter ATP-binding protein [Actinomadura sp. HBU206391]|uniref:ABC transporter ATP-binding protein n=1 Tax=Actinomadura sp. HBU206391 TaxID=2731692 RepID=UPI0016502DF4|nr:ABC transporter ATP-binding protein [Actinomadura sp. HBU206391]MBC6463780.1 ABC transporter ATP-binding protein [Actinomadura sp. HBU206391]
MLSIEDLHVRYGTTHAVCGIGLRVEPGEAVALLGPNGAGKSSTLRAVSRLVTCTGSIVFDGRDITRVAAEEVARQGLIHVPEGRRVFRDLTVHENLQLGTTARRGRPVVFSFDDVYDLFPPLTRLRDRLGFALSGGEQQMVALGRALVAAPRLLLIDEPSLGLAPVVADAVARALAEVRSRTALLLIEQNVHLAVRVCGRAAVMSGGRIVMEAPTAELQDRDQLLASYLGQTRTGTGV